MAEGWVNEYIQIIFLDNFLSFFSLNPIKKLGETAGDPCVNFQFYSGVQDTFHTMGNWRFPQNSPTHKTL